MHTLPSEISSTASSIGTSTLFAAWNAAIYVAQVEDDLAKIKAELGQGSETPGELPSGAPSTEPAPEKGQ